MNIFKKFLAMFLFACLVVGLLPTTSIAAEDTGIDSYSISSITMGTKPSGGTTTAEPFSYGTGGSNSFRIPALVTLSNGNLLAAADARWNTTYDGGGLDTIVSVSSDNGDTWKYNFANYLGDNGNSYDGDASTAFIDPALAVDGDTVYMLVDIYPYGVALNGSGNTHPSTNTGFNSDGKLLLSADNHSSYGYYLDGNTIYAADGTAVSGYTVDEYFNITETATGDTSNLFFSNSPYKVVRTGFLYLTKSSDGGETWSAPELLNLKNGSEQVCLVAPGRGLVTDNGNVIFPTYHYHYNNGTPIRYMSFISMDAETGEWSRSTSMKGASWSSESAVVALEDGTLRFFYRNGTTNLCYVDYNNGWGTPVVMTGIDTNSNCQISAISYSKTIDGKQVILVSCPTGPDEAGSDQSGASYRLNGKIFAFTVEDDGTMSKVGSVNVTSNNAQFMYSCMTELTDGTIGILYEDCESKWGAGDGCYYTMEYDEFDLTTAMGLTFDTAASGDATVESDVTITAGATMVNATKVENITALADKTYLAYDITVSEESVDSATVVVKLNNTFADEDKLIAYYINESGEIAETIDGTYDATADTFTFTATHFSTYAVTTVDDSNDVTITDTVDVRIPVGGTSETYTHTDGNYEASATIKNSSVATMNIEGKTIEGGTTETVMSSVTVGSSYYIKSSDGKYLDASGSWVNDIAGAVEWTVNEYFNGSTYYYLTCKNGNTTYYLRYTNNGSVSAVTNQNNRTRFYYVNNEFNTGSNNNGNALGAAVTLTTTDPVAATEVSFTGVSAGNTTAIVGTTQYNIEVYALKNINVIYQCNGTTVASEAMSVESDATEVTLLSHVMGTTGTAYAVTNTTLTLTDAVNYIVSVTELEALSATVAENASATLTLDYTLSNGQYVVWTSEDSDVAVAGNYSSSGAYTNSATIIGNAVNRDGVLVSGTVYNADGTVAYASNWIVTVTEGTGNSNTTSKYIYISIGRIQNTTVYYNINGGELIEITDDMLEGPYTDANGTYYKLKVALMDEQYTGGFQISFFAKPDDGYALTYMASTNSAGQYYTLSDGNPDGVGSDAWPFADGYDYDSFDSLTSKPAGSDTSAWDTDKGIRWGLIEGNFTVAQMKVMFTNAISKGCDGILVFTKNSDGTTNGSTSNYNSNDLVTDLTFVSQKLPEMSKEIATVNGETYTEGTALKLGDKIVYNVYVYEPTQISEYGTITYSNINLQDPLTGDSWTSKSSTYSTGTYTFTNSATGEGLTMSATRYTYTTTVLTLSVSNLLELVDEQGHITNTATLEYDYSSQYSTGTLAASADAVVSAKVEVPEYVIDFGVPVQFNLTNNPLIEGYETIVKATAQYGTVTWDGLTVTYTPNKIMQGADFIRLTIADAEGSTDNIGYGIRIYPATTIHYEESFVSWGSNWTGGNAAITVGKQTTEQLNVDTTEAATSDNGKVYNYGYDPVYAEVVGASNGSNAITSTIGAKATFTFTGTGIQILANATEESGYVAVQVTNSSGSIVNLSMVDTIVDEGTTGATSGQTGNLYGLPIVSLIDLQNMPHGTYTVTLTKIMDTEPVYIDGIRVFNTMADSTIYANDLEDNPDFYELRDYVLNALSVGTDAKLTADELAAVVDQVYAAISNDSEKPASAVITSGSNSVITDTATAQDLLDNGPKNELYLYAGQTLTFKATTSRIMQIGMKAPQGATAASISINNGTATAQDVKSSVDMFYNLVSTAAGSDTEYTISITNTGDTILSVTLLKVCDDPNFAFASLTEADIENVLLDVYDLVEEPAPVYADATLDITVNDADGNALATTQLTANGIEGEEATFTAADIQAAVEGLELPDNYNLDDVTYSDITVAYGASARVDFTAEKELTQEEQVVETIKQIFSSISNFFKKFFRW